MTQVTFRCVLQSFTVLFTSIHGSTYPPSVRRTRMALLQLQALCGAPRALGDLTRLW